MGQRFRLVIIYSLYLLAGACQKNGPIQIGDQAPALLTLAQARSILRDGNPMLLPASGTMFERAGESYTVLSPSDAPSAQTWVEIRLPRSAAGRTELALKNSLRMDIDLELVGASARAAAAPTDGYLIYEHALGDAALIQRASRWGTEDYVYFPTKPAAERLEYKVTLRAGVSSLRLVGGTLEFLDRDGTPGLRMATPYGIDTRSAYVRPSVSVVGCNYDSNTSVYAPAEEKDIGSTHCAVSLDWSASGATYPLLVDPEWSAASQLPAGNQRWSGFINKLPSGDVFVSSIASQASQIFRAASGTWSATAASPVGSAMSARSVVLNDGTVLIGEANSIYKYDPGAGTYMVRAVPPAYRQRAAMITLPSGLVMYAGGQDSAGAGVYNSTYLYNPTTDTWATTGSMPIARRDTNLVQLDANRIVAIDGSGAGVTPVEASEIYSISGGTWSTLAASGTTGIIAPNLLKLSDGNILVSGSWNNQTVSRLLNGTTLAWSNPGAMPFGMRSRGQSLAESGGIVYGLSDGVSSVNQYTVSAGTWAAGPTLPSYLGVEASAVTLADGRILAVSSTEHTQVLSICGDAVLNPGEACDDGNAASGDGCSATCAVESGFECARNNIVPNGDFELPLNATSTYTVYGTGTTLGGAGGNWLVISGDVEIDNSIWTTPSGRQSIDMSGNNRGAIAQTIPTVAGRRYVWQMRAASNGGGLKNTTLSVASGTSLSWNLRSNLNVRGNPPLWDLFSGSFTAGSTSTTFTLTGLDAGSAGMVLDDVRAHDVTALACTPLCGNGVLNGAETCDDGNRVSGDGCSATCASESGFSCPRQSNLLNGDVEQPVLNNATCTNYAAGSTAVNGWTIAGSDVDLCNNAGATAPTGMQLFDLNGGNPGGISQVFSTTVGRQYAWEARIAQNNACGAASKTGYVNIQSGAGVNTTTNFSTSTAWTAGTWDLVSGSFAANSAASTMLVFSTTIGGCGPAVDAIRVYDITSTTCVSSCGNGLVSAGEDCDDGNTTAGDGCSATCTLEAGNVCDAPINLVVNGSFESPGVPAASSGTLTGAGIPSWAIAPNSDVDVVSNGFSGLVSALGVQALDSNGGRAAMVSQAVATTAGMPHVWSTRVANLSAGTRSAAVTMQLDTASARTWLASSSTVANSTNWDTIGGKFTPVTGSITYSYQSLAQGSSGLHADDVRISRVQSCRCNGNLATGMSRACPNASLPICNAGICQADATATCP